MDVEAAFLHAAEPGHLALGELVDGGFELTDHLVVGELAGEVEGEELVLQAVIDQVLGWDVALVEQATYFIDHTGIEALTQTAGDTLTAHLTIDLCAYDETGHGGIAGELLGMGAIVIADLNLADGSLAGIGIGNIGKGAFCACRRKIK